MGTGGRRRGMRAVAAVAVALVLGAAACSDDGGSTSEGAGADPTADPAPVGTGAPAGGAGDLPERFAGYRSDVYEDPAAWLCRPDLDDDACDLDLDRTVIAADGTTEVVEVEADPEAPVDCFYVYPTVNPGPDPVDEAMAADTVAEDAVAGVQLAPFGEVCRIFAPLYRQITFAGFGAPDAAELSARAYDDVRDAFAHYLANDSDGRPVVLFGHSQGSFLLTELLAEEFDGDEAMTARLVSALLIGGSAATAEGGDVGGSFEALPTCASPEQVGCIVGWNSVGEGASSGVLDTWGSAGPGLARVCTNPAALGGGPAPLLTIQQTDAAAEGLLAVDTPYFELDGGITGACTTIDGAQVLLATPSPAWPAEELARLTTNVDFWGLHIVDVNLAMGDLIELVRSQSAAMAG